MARSDFSSVDDYLASLSPQTRVAVDQVRSVLREAFPGGEERISYQIPAFRYQGTYALYVAGYAGHYAVYPATAGILAALGAELAPYLSGKATIRFELAEPVPVDLLRRIAACRAAEIAASAQTKAAGRKPKAPRG